MNVEMKRLRGRYYSDREGAHRYRDSLHQHVEGKHKVTSAKIKMASENAVFRNIAPKIVERLENRLDDSPRHVTQIRKDPAQSTHLTIPHWYIAISRQVKERA